MSDAYHRRTSSVHSQVTNNLEVHLYIIRIRVDRGWSLEGPRRSIHGCQIKTHQLSIVEYGSPNTTETILINSQIYHKSQAEIKESRACSTVSNAFFLDLGNNRVDVPGIYI